MKMMSEEKLKKLQQEEGADFMAVICVKDGRSWVKMTEEDPLHTSIVAMTAMETMCDVSGVTMQEWCDMALKLHNQKAIESVDTVVSNETKKLLNKIFKEE